jgi:hypothetical protein
MSKIIYTITLNNWSKHQSKHKEHYKKFLFYNNFFSDDKVAQLTPIEVTFFVYLLCIASEKASDCVQIHVKSLPKGFRISDKSMSNYLTRFEQLQLVSIEKRESLIIKRRERIEVKERIERINSISPTETNQAEKQETKMPDIPDQRSDPPSKLISIWNDHCGELQKVRKSNPTRDRKIKALFNKLSELEWIEVIKKLAASNFCNGKNDRGWKADFDFLLKPETYSRTLEGRYDNRAQTQFGMTDDGRYLTPAVKRSHNNRVMIEKYLKPKGDKDGELLDVESSPVDSGVS